MNAMIESCAVHGRNLAPFVFYRAGKDLQRQPKSDWTAETLGMSCLPLPAQLDTWCREANKRI